MASGKPEKKHPLWTGTRSGQVLDNAMAGVRQSWAIADIVRPLNPLMSSKPTDPQVAAEVSEVGTVDVFGYSGLVTARRHGPGKPVADDLCLLL